MFIKNFKTFKIFNKFFKICSDFYKFFSNTVINLIYNSEYLNCSKLSQTLINFIKFSLIVLKFFSENCFIIFENSLKFSNI